MTVRRPPEGIRRILWMRRGWRCCTRNMEELRNTSAMPSRTVVPRNYNRSATVHSVDIIEAGAAAGILSACHPGMDCNRTNPIEEFLAAINSTIFHHDN